MAWGSSFIEEICGGSCGSIKSLRAITRTEVTAHFVGGSIVQVHRLRASDMSKHSAF